MIVTVECQPKVSISRHLLFVGRFRAMNLGELKEIFDSAGLPLVSSTSSTTGTTGTTGTTSASAGSPGSGSDAVNTLDTLDAELEVQLVLSQESEALAKSMWRPLRTTGDQISVVSFNMLLKGGVWMGMVECYEVMNIFYWCDGRIGARVCQELLGQVQQAGDEMQLCFVWNCLRKGINNIQVKQDLRLWPEALLPEHSSSIEILAMAKTATATVNLWYRCGCLLQPGSECESKFCKGMTVWQGPFSLAAKQTLAESMQNFMLQCVLPVFCQSFTSH